MNFVLPGMGATSEMFSGPWRELRNTHFIDWPNGTQISSIEALATELIKLHSIKENDSVFGTSLGGIVACEISNKIQLNHLVLIGSATSNEEISPFLQFLHPMVNLTPLELIQQFVGKFEADCTKMFSQSDPQFIRTMSKAIFRWDGLASGTVPFRIHGTNDQIIPIPDEVDVCIEGGHLIAMTHTTECVQAVMELFGFDV